ncbi:MAG TPA: ATP-binding cassette domain-containing protein, partial [Kineosporiaceae bacterium]|nr:ATP-binding cassette domain-containing protein [Kineosporiaceae bacterium]
RIAVVGGSGCGKTTLLLTLAGLIPPVAGRVTLGSERVGSEPVGPVAGTTHGEATHGEATHAGPADLERIDPGIVRRTVSFTAEDAHIFTTTVRENLRVARPDADDAELSAVLQRAGLGDWTTGLPAGLDTMLGSGGTGLSGGERRRLLLARALLVGAGVLLLDEPVEHLDPQTADALVHDVLSASGSPQDPAVVVVTHRLAPLAAADEVLLLGSGHVVARGTHMWLRKSNLTYRDAWLAEQGGALPPDLVTAGDDSE